MEPQLSARLDSILGFLEESIRSGAALATDQAPEVIRQLLAWKLAENILVGLVGLAFCVTAIYFSVKLARRGKTEKEKDRYSGGEGFYAGATILVAFGFVNSIVFVCCMLEALQVVIAPKVYLLEYAASLVTP